MCYTKFKRCETVTARPKKHLRFRRLPRNEEALAVPEPFRFRKPPFKGKRENSFVVQFFFVILIFSLEKEESSPTLIGKKCSLTGSLLNGAANSRSKIFALSLSRKERFCFCCAALPPTLDPSVSCTTEGRRSISVEHRR